MKLEKFVQARVGDGGGDGGGDDGDDGRIFPEHPSPILHAPRDIISRKGKSLTPICSQALKAQPGCALLTFADAQGVPNGWRLHKAS